MQRVEDISADGLVIIGKSGTESFLWTLATGMAPISGIPSGRVVAVSGDGSVITGRSYDPSSELSSSWRRSAQGDVAFLEEGLPPGSESHSEGISADGTVIAGTFGDMGGLFRWTEGTGLVVLDPPSLFHMSAAFGISADGSTVFGFGVDDMGAWPVMWTQSRGVSSPERLVGGEVWGIASASSSDGSVIAGTEKWGGTDPQIFRHTEAEGVTALSDLGANPPEDFPRFDTSNTEDTDGLGNTIVGWGTYYTAPRVSTDRAFVWSRLGGMRLLEDVLMNDHQLDLTGWTLTQAEAISDDGRTIAGDGVNPSGFEEGWVVILPPVCDDGIDNDRDGLVDLADPSCLIESSASSEQSAALVCDNGLDDDGDGLVDVAEDPGCDHPTDPSEQSSLIACDDGDDNDGDGTIDLEDPGCTEPADGAETDPALPCDDAIDNDGDGGIDLADPGCGTSSWVTESPQCSDGIDNDYDGLIDFDGGASQNGGQSLASLDDLCDNAADNKEHSGPSCGLLGIEPFILLGIAGAVRRLRRLSVRHELGHL
jgi:uncharacterized membrane protein